MPIQSANRAIVKRDTYIYRLNKATSALILQNPSIMLCRGTLFLLTACPQSWVFLPRLPAGAWVTAAVGGERAR